MHRRDNIIILFLGVFISALSCNPVTPEITSGFIKAGGLQNYYERQGKGEAVLLLHAGLQDHTMWQEQSATFYKQYDVVTIDMPFHGNSGGTDTTILVQNVLNINLDSLQIKKTLIASLSMGASAVQDFIIAYQERVNKAVLISAGINGFEKEFPVDPASMNWYNLISKALENIGLGFPDDFF